jgi:hypothetical protein
MVIADRRTRERAAGADGRFRRAAWRSAPGRGRDVDALAELPWAALHGVITLPRSARLAREKQAKPADLLVAKFAGVPASARVGPQPMLVSFATGLPDSVLILSSPSRPSLQCGDALMGGEK